MNKVIFNHSEILNEFIKTNKYIIGIDMGESYMGIAKSNLSKNIANPYIMYKRRTPEKDIEWIRDLCLKNESYLLVIGIPLDHNFATNEVEELSKWAKKILSFAKMVASKITNIKVFLQDESCTTMIAKDFSLLLERKQKIRYHIDMIAASAILQRFLDKYKL